MRKLIVTIIAVLTTFTAKAGEIVPYIPMPISIGYATDAKGVRHHTAFAMRDVVFGPRPQYPLPYGVGDPSQFVRELKGDGLYQLYIDLTTGRVANVTVVKSTGSKFIDQMTTDVFRRWRFKPTTWKQVQLPTHVSKKWWAVVPGG
jgi:TonB family protein